MNDDAEFIRAALGRRFARVAIPACPNAVWHATATATAARSRILPRRFAYAAALLVVVAFAGLAAQASNIVKLTYANLISPFFVSSKPLMPGIHPADRLALAEAQRRMPFPIVVPTGLPAGTRFLYAHVISEHPTPRVALTYEAHVAKRYYRISVNESTFPVGSRLAHFKVQILGRGTKEWTLPIRRWKHGALVMDLFAWGLPSEMSDEIVRANAR